MLLVKVLSSSRIVRRDGDYILIIVSWQYVKHR